MGVVRKAARRGGAHDPTRLMGTIHEPWAGLGTSVKHMREFGWHTYMLLCLLEW